LHPLFARRVATALRARRTLAALALASLGSCQLHKPAPLIPEAHREEWSARLTTIDPVLHGAGVVHGEASSSGGPILSGGAMVTQGTATRLELSDGLDLSEGLLVALVHHPDLRRARQKLEGAAWILEASGAPLDPALQSNLLRIRGPAEDPWVLTPNLAFSLPLTGQLEAARGRASAAQRASLTAVVAAEWRVQREVRLAWVEWSASAAELAVQEGLLAQLRELAARAAGLLDRGELSAPEAALFQLGLAEGAADLEALRGACEGARLRLLGELGLHPSAAVELVPLDLTARTAPPAFQTVDRRGHPRLQHLEARYEEAEQGLRLALARQLTDPLVGPMLESDGGQLRWGLTLGWTLPLFNGNRLGIAQARDARDRARTELEVEREALEVERAWRRAQLEGLLGQHETLASGLLPVAEDQLAEAARLAALGELSSLALLECVDRARQARLARVAASRRQANEEAHLTWAMGPEPRTQHEENER
jgi:cobalt-zinc-cadmium efflux system outer membrane protein